MASGRPTPAPSRTTGWSRAGPRRRCGVRWARASRHLAMDVGCGGWRCHLRPPGRRRRRPRLPPWAGAARPGSTRAGAARPSGRHGHAGVAERAARGRAWRLPGAGRTGRTWTTATCCSATTARRIRSRRRGAGGRWTSLGAALAVRTGGRSMEREDDIGVSLAKQHDLGLLVLSSARARSHLGERGHLDQRGHATTSSPLLVVPPPGGCSSTSMLRDTAASSGTRWASWRRRRAAAGRPGSDAAAGGGVVVGVLCYCCSLPMHVREKIGTWGDRG